MKNVKNIIISGSSSGIGRGLTERLLPLNYQVVGLARGHEKFNPQHKQYFPYKLDFANIGALESELHNIKRIHSDIDIIVCCAGYGHFADVEQFSLKQMQTMLDVNFLSQAVLIKTFLPILKSKRQGKIIVVGSETALAGAKQASMYAASKFALRGFCQSLRQECRYAGVSVTLINPGLVRTPFFENLNFMPDLADENAIQIADIVETLVFAIETQPACVIEEINVQPLRAAVKRKVRE